MNQAMGVTVQRAHQWFQKRQAERRVTSFSVASVSGALALTEHLARIEIRLRQQQQQIT